MVDFNKIGSKDNILKVSLQVLSTIIDDILHIDKQTSSTMKELAGLFLEEMGNQYSSQELVVKFISPEMTLQEFKRWIKNREELARSMGL